MYLKQFILLIVLCTVSSVNGQYTAIMGAMNKEIELLKKELKNTKEIQKNGVTFFTGELQDKKVVLLKAGIGKVNAAYSTAILIENFDLDILIFTGVAGGLHPDIEPGDIVIADKLVQYDFGKLTPEGFVTWPSKNLAQNNSKNPFYIPVDSILLEQSKKVSQHISLKPLNDNMPKFYVGTIATGDTFVSDSEKAKELHAKFNAIATEMEGAAVAQICSMLEVPFIVIRSCSDNANTEAHTDYLTFVEIAAVNSAQMVLGLLAP